KLDRLVLDRTENAVRQACRLAPRLAAVFARLEHAPPLTGARADFVKEHQRTVVRLEEDRIPRRLTRTVRLHSIRRLGGREPLAIDAAADPDTDVGVALARSAEERGDEPARSLRDRRCMTRRKRRGLVEEFGTDHA